MRALQLNRHGGELTLGSAPEPEPGAGDVVVQVTHCAVAVGDLLVASGARQEYHGTRDSFIYPHTLGFQGIGTIVGLGVGVAPERLGELVTINGVIGCGECRECRSGTENRCPDHALLGLDSGYPGCLAEFVRVPARNAHVWPRRLSPALAPFISELATMAHVVRRIGCGPGESLAVLGAGQTGVFGVAAAQVAGVDRIISIDMDPERLELARRLGADEVINSQGTDPVSAVHRLTGDGVSRAIEVVGSSDTLAQTLRMLAPRGVAGLLGTGRDIVLDLPDYEQLIAREISIKGCLGKTNREYALALSWVTQERVDLSILPVDVYPLRRFQDAWRAAERRGAARVVIEINPVKS